MKAFYVCVFMFLAVSQAQSQNKNFIDQPYIEVSGSADSLVTPNEIYIRIVISEKDTRDKISVEEQEIKMVAAFKSLGIDTEKKLSTSDIGSNFKSYLLKGKDVLKTKQFSLKVVDAVTATKVFMKLEELDISNMSIEKVAHSNMDEIKNAMRSIAVQNAKTRAVALTKPLNQTVGGALHIIDVENYNNQLQGRVAGLDEVVVTGYGMQRDRQAELPQIDFKKIPVRTNVSVKFVLK